MQDTIDVEGTFCQSEVDIKFTESVDKKFNMNILINALLIFHHALYMSTYIANNKQFLYFYFV